MNTSVTITYADGRTETLNMNAFRRRKHLAWCRRCDTYHGPGRCPMQPITSQARKRAAIGRYTPKRDGIDAL